jgi:hypothetical protein
MGEKFEDKQGDALQVGDLVTVTMIVKELTHNTQSNTLLLTYDPSRPTGQHAYLQCCSTQVTKVQEKS